MVFVIASQLRRVGLCDWGKGKCAICGLAEFQNILCGEEKIKKQRVGNECRLTRCPVIVSFLCLYSPAKMVYYLFKFGCLVNIRSVVLPFVPRRLMIIPYRIAFTLFNAEHDPL